MNHDDAVFAAPDKDPGNKGGFILTVAIADVAAGGHRALHPYVLFVTEAMVTACHEAGLALNTWTCDDPDRMVELARWGVDGICTNVPDVAVSALADHH